MRARIGLFTGNEDGSVVGMFLGFDVTISTLSTRWMAITVAIYRLFFFFFEKGALATPRVRQGRICCTETSFGAARRFTGFISR